MLSAQATGSGATNLTFTPAPGSIFVNSYVSYFGSSYNNFVVNDNHGTIVNQAPRLPVTRRAAVPRAPNPPILFLDRTDEAHQVTAALTGPAPRAAALFGRDGVGKSSLLRQVANHLPAAYPDGVLLIEGVGGVMVPVDDRHTVLDWMSALALPVILVVGNYLGTISHTLTALGVLADRKLEVLSIVVSDTARTASLEDNARAIARFAAGLEVMTLPRLARNSFRHPTFVELAARVLGGG